MEKATGKLALVIEDDASVATIIRDYLDASAFSVSVAPTGETGLRRFRSDSPSVIILDLGLPGRSGIDVLRDIRAQSMVPIIIVTARGEETDRVVGLELGADDYIVKPFSPRELVARVRAVLRRTESQPSSEPVIAIGSLVINEDRMTVSSRDEQILLTATEFRLLAAMARRPGHVFSRTQLQDVLYGDDPGASDRTIDAHIKNLRRKLELDPSNPTIVTTVHGVGYRVNED
jgi:two-component system alkaline phosphatase synthesis response regulator PhoP